MKRLHILLGLTLVCLSMPNVVLGDTTDDVRNACYATTKCGGRNVIKDLTFVVGTGTAMAVGGAVGSLLPGPWSPLGTGVGIGAGLVYGSEWSSKLGGKLAHSYSANEYIYLDEENCLECDTHQIGEYYECPNGTIVSNGPTWYRCRTTAFDDFWEETKPSICRDSKIQRENVENAEIVDIKATVEKEAKAGTRVWVYTGDVCIKIDCREGFYLENGACKKKEKPAPREDEEEPEEDPVRESCVDTRSTPEGKACCSLDASVAVFNGGKCECKNGADFTYEKLNNGKLQGYCTLKQEDNSEEKKCTGQNVAWDKNANKCVCVGGVPGQYKMYTNPSNGTYYCAVTSGYKVCEPLITQGVASWISGRCVCKDKNKEFIGGSCEYTQEFLNEQQADKLSKEIEKIGKTLDAVTDTFEISKWRNADGEFNTARLASDSVAAVVLGTAGGLISSKVIKKKQIEDGFEDIKCIIGSQTVADYGDEFQVGIQ